MAHSKVQFKTISPFGPPIGMIKLPNECVDILLKLTEETKNHNINQGPRLAGVLENELRIPLELLKESGMDTFFDNCFRQYVISSLSTHGIMNLSSGKLSEYDEGSIQTELTEAWVNYQFENEYNPLHYHTGCTLSSTLYLKIPKYESRNIPGKQNLDGNIVFVNGNVNTPSTSLEAPLINLEPEVGDMFIWPSRLLHEVYPFKGKGERRSVAINAIHSFL